MGHDRRIGLLLLAPILGALAFAYIRLVGALGDAPSDDDYRAARALLEKNGFDKAHDALVILPPWSLRPLRFVGDLGPISGDDIADKPLHRYAHLWALVEPDADKEHAPLVARRGAPVFSASAGAVTVERFDLPPASVLWDLRAHLADAQVQIVDGGVARPCDVAIAGGFACAGKEGWQRVNRQWVLVSENADDAVWSHPPPRGQRLEIAWRDVPVGVAVVVQAGFLREGADAAKAPVKLTVKVDDTIVGSLTRAPAFSFYTDVIDTRRFAGSRATLTLVEETDDNASAHFAWDAVVIGEVTR